MIKQTHMRIMIQAQINHTSKFKKYIWTGFSFVALLSNKHNQNIDLKLFSVGSIGKNVQMELYKVIIIIDWKNLETWIVFFYTLMFSIKTTFIYKEVYLSVIGLKICSDFKAAVHDKCKQLECLHLQA